MKRLLFILIACLTFATGLAKGSPDIKFDRLAHDFGTIREADGTVKCTFTYTNTGNAPLALATVSTSCNCTKAKFSPKPLAPGKSDKITVTFLPDNSAGEFMRTITVRTNIKTADGKKKKVMLTVSGTVIPKK